MMNRKLIATGLIGLMGIAVGCKPRSSELRGVELADKDESSGKSVYIYTPDKKKVFYRVCPNTWKPRERIDVSESAIEIDLVFDASKLQDPATAQQELKKLEALIEAYRKSAEGQGVVVSGETIKDPYDLAQCTQDDLYRTPIDYDKYVTAVGNSIGVVKPEAVSEMREKLQDKQFAIKGLVSELVKAKSQMEAGNRDITPEKYAGAVKTLSDKMRDAQEMHAQIRDLEIKRRTYNDIISNLPVERKAGLVNNLTNERAFKAMLEPFNDVANVNKEIYARVKRDMKFQYAGKMPYVQGLDHCSSKGMVMAGRLEFYYLNRFINGRERIPGWGSNGSGGSGNQGGQQGGQNQDQNPVDPTIEPLSGQFWVGTFAYDLSRALAIQSYHVYRRAEQSQVANPYSAAELSAYANAANSYLPANFDFASEVGLQGTDSRQGYNFSWSLDYSNNQYQAGPLYGQEKHVLCVANRNFDYTDEFIKFVNQKINEGVQEFKTTTYNWSRNSAGNDHAAYLYRAAAYRYDMGRPEWAQIKASQVWICSAKMTGFSNDAANKYNFHNLVFTAQPNAETTRNYVIANCHANNRSVIRGQGVCSINVCTDCKNLLDQTTYPCSKPEKDREQQQQQQQQQGQGNQNQNQNQQQDQDFQQQF